jgi:potential 5'-3' exonuclease
MENFMSQGFNDSSVHVSTVLNNVGTDGTGYRSFDTDSAAQGTQPFDMQNFLASSGTATVQTQEQDPLACIPSLAEAQTPSLNGESKHLSKKQWLQDDPSLSKSRIVLVDFNHLIHRFVNAGYSSNKPYRLTHTVMVDGVRKTLETNVPDGILKFLVRATSGGYDRLVVVSDLPVPSRRALFNEIQSVFDNMYNTSASYPQAARARTGSTEAGYKEGRSSAFSAQVREGVRILCELLQGAGVHVISKQDYEADDLIGALVRRLKVSEPTTPIDVICNDSDLLPLVDEQVSVWYRRTNHKGDIFPPSSHPLYKSGYEWVTPQNFSQVVSSLSAFKCSKKNPIVVPLGGLLLVKMLRGDKSDGISGVPGATPSFVNDALSQLQESFGAWNEKHVRDIQQGCYQAKTLGSVFAFGGSYAVMQDALIPLFVKDEVVLSQLRQWVLAERAKGLSGMLFELESLSPADATGKSKGNASGVPVFGLVPQVQALLEELRGSVTEHKKDRFFGVGLVARALANHMLMDLNSPLGGLRVKLREDAFESQQGIPVYDYDVLKNTAAMRLGSNLSDKYFAVAGRVG